MTNKRSGRDVTEFICQLIGNSSKGIRRRPSQLGQLAVGLQEVPAELGPFQLRHLQRHGSAKTFWAFVDKDEDVEQSDVTQQSLSNGFVRMHRKRAVAARTALVEQHEAS